MKLGYFLSSFDALHLCVLSFRFVVLAVVATKLGTIMIRRYHSRYLFSNSHAQLSLYEFACLTRYAVDNFLERVASLGALECTGKSLATSVTGRHRVW